jgi:CRISPR/Cas system-associated endonuclease Cas3-HD
MQTKWMGKKTPGRLRNFSKREMNLMLNKIGRKKTPGRLRNFSKMRRRSSIMAEPNYNLWGKYNNKTGEIHLSLFHMLDSGFAAREFMKSFLPNELEFIAKMMNLTVEELLEVIPHIVPPHDLGKITPEFVMQKPELAAILTKQGFTFEGLNTDNKIRHEVFSKFLAEQLFPSFPAKKDICAIDGGHHGRFSWLPLKNIHKTKYNEFVKRSGFNNKKWKEQQKIAYKIIRKVFPCKQKILNKIVISDDFLLCLASIVSIIDWIASNEEIFPHVGTNVTWQKYVLTLPDKASKIKEKI